MLQVIDATTRLYEALHHADKVRVLHPLERKLGKALVKAFKAQGKAFMKGFVKLKDRFPAPTSEAYRLREVLTVDELAGLFDQSDKDSFEAFVTPLLDAVAASLLAAGKAQVAELGMGLNFTLKNPRAVAYLKAHGAELVANINATTREYINTILKQVAEEGWSYDQAARAIIERYGEFAVGVPGQFDSRAQRIAVNELGNAYCEGNFEPIQDLMDAGIKMEKSWDVAPELSQTGPCDECQANADQGWIPADEPFHSGDDHPLQHVNCYCDCYYEPKGA
jgi:hypothetical protein